MMTTKMTKMMMTLVNQGFKEKQKTKKQNTRGNLHTFCLGFPMTAGKTDLGQSSPAIPVLQRPEPLSMTTAGFVTWDMVGMGSLVASRWGRGGEVDGGDGENKGRLGL